MASPTTAGQALQSMTHESITNAGQIIVHLTEQESEITKTDIKPMDQ